MVKLSLQCIRKDSLLSLHVVYKSLGKDDVSHQIHCCGLFENHLSKADKGDTREATNKAWILANDRFKVKIEQLIDRQIQAKPRGGDRRSDIFKKKGNINRVLTALVLM